MKCLIIIILIFYSFSPTSAVEWIVEGNKVYSDSSKAMISVEPHTLGSGRQTITVEAVSKLYSGSIDIAFLLEGDGIRPRGARYYSPHNESRVVSYTCPLEGYGFSYSTAPKSFSCYTMPTVIDNGTNESRLGNQVVVFNHSYIGGDLDSRIAWWYEYEEVEYRGISGRFEYSSNMFNGLPGYEAVGLNVIAGTLEQLIIDVDVDFMRSGKYWICIKPTGGSYSNERCIDPWFDTSLDEAMEIVVRNLNTTFVLENGSTIVAQFDGADLIANHGVNLNGSNLYMVMENLTDSTFTEISRLNITAFNNDSANITFALRENISAGADSNDTNIRYHLFFNGFTGQLPLNDTREIFRFGYDQFDPDNSEQLPQMAWGNFGNGCFASNGSLECGGAADTSDIGTAPSFASPASTQITMIFHMNCLLEDRGGNDRGICGWRGGTGSGATGYGVNMDDGEELSLDHLTGNDAETSLITGGGVVVEDTWYDFLFVYASGQWFARFQGVTSGSTAFNFVSVTGLSHAAVQQQSAADVELDNWWAGLTIYPLPTTINLAIRGQFGDQSPPNITFIPPTPDNLTIRGLDFVFVNVSVGDNNGTAIGDCVLDFDGTNSSMSKVGSGSNVFCNFNKTGLADGNHTYRVFANNTDGALNVSENRSVDIDTTLPLIVVDIPTNITFSMNTIELNATNVDVHRNQTWYSLDGAANTSFTFNISLNTTLFSLADGAHNVRVCGNDTVSFENCTQVFFTVDTSPVNITVFSPQNTTLFTPAVPLTLTVNGDDDFWIYNLDGSGNVTFVPNTTILIMQNGSHNIEFFVHLTDGAIRGNTTWFSLNFTSNTTKFLPPTPASGGGLVGFGSSGNASAVVEAFKPQTYKLRLASTEAGGFGSPVLFFFESGNIFTSGMHFFSGGAANITYERSLSLAPGNYSYFVQVFDDQGISHVSALRFVITFLPATGLQPLLTTFTGSMPRSHDKVNIDDVLSISGLALAVNGTLDNATFYILDEDGNNILRQVDLTRMINSDGSYTLSGSTTLPSGHNRVALQIGVNDSGGRVAYSNRLVIVLVDNNEDSIVKTGLAPFTNPLPAERGSPEENYGQYLAGTVFGLALMGGSLASGAGIIPAVALGGLGLVELASFGNVPSYVSIIVFMVMAIMAVTVMLGVFGKRGG